MTTNTVARPYTNSNRLTPIGLRTGFLGKPSRSVKALDLSLNMKAQMSPLVEEETAEQSENAFEDSTVKVKDEVDEETARQQKVRV